MLKAKPGLLATINEGQKCHGLDVYSLVKSTVCSSSRLPQNVALSELRRQFYVYCLPPFQTPTVQGTANFLSCASGLRASGLYASVGVARLQSDGRL